MKKTMFTLMAALLAVFWLQTPAPAATGDREKPVIAYATQSNRYFVVYEKSPDDFSSKDIYRQVIKADGTAYTTEFVISNGVNSQAPSVAYDSVTQRFLVV